MPDVQRSGDGGRRGVDREDLGPRPRPVERVDLIGLPANAPYRLKPVEHGLVGDGGGARVLVGVGHAQTLLSAPVRPHAIFAAPAAPGHGTPRTPLAGPAPDRLSGRHRMAGRLHQNVTTQITETTAGSTTSIVRKIAAELGVRDHQVSAAVDLLDGGATVPFIARYRKEATGTLDDAQLRTLDERLRYLRELEERRTAILASVDEQGKLTDELRAQIDARRHQGQAGGPLPPLQAQAQDQGPDRPRERPRAARRPAARDPGDRPEGGGRGLPQRERGRRHRRPRRGPRDPGRALRRGRRPDRHAPRADVGPGQPDRQGPRGQGRGGQEVQRLLRLRRAVRPAQGAPRAGDVPGREGRDPRPHPQPERRGLRRHRRHQPVRLLRAADRRPVRHHGPRLARRQVADRHRPLGLAHPHPGPPRHRPADAAVAERRGGGGRRVRRQPAGPAAGRPGRPARDHGPRPRLPHRRQGRGHRPDRQAGRDPHDLPARPPEQVGRVAARS